MKKNWKRLENDIASFGQNGTNHHELVPRYLIISLAKIFRYGPPGPKILESTSLKGA